jgi:RNA polymerase sigma factor (TIGR02999 family)
MGEGASITALLVQWRQGDERALEALTPLVYDNLRRIARRQMSSEGPGHTLSPTALVHEAFMRLIDARVSWQDRAHFLAIAAREMRRVLVEHARAQRRLKRGGSEWRQVTLREDAAASEGDAADILAVDQALNGLAEFDPRKAEVVNLVLFAGMTAREAAEVLNVSEATLNRELRMARVWLRHRLQSDSPGKA